MRFCDGDYIYYEIIGDSSGYYKIDTNGNYCSYADYYADEFAYNKYEYNISSYRLTGRRMYYIDKNDTLYSKTRNGGDLHQIKRIETGMSSDIVKVTKNYIYYITQWSEDPYVWLYRIDRN